jgi:hypothetical protein
MQRRYRMIIVQPFPPCASATEVAVWRGAPPAARPSLPG